MNGSARSETDIWPDADQCPVFIPASQITSNKPEDLKRTLLVQEEVIDDLLTKLAQKEMELEKLRDSLKAKTRAALKHELTDNEIVDRAELKRLRKEVKELQEKHARLGADRRSESEQIRDERQELSKTAKKTYDLLNSILIKPLAIITEHEADNQELRDLARDLRTKPDEIKSRVKARELTCLEACCELVPLLEAAGSKIATFRKKGLPETKTDHRARIGIESTERLGSLTLDAFTDIITGDEGQRPKKTVVLRAMKRAAELEPHKVIFLVGDRNGTQSQLRRTGSS